MRTQSQEVTRALKSTHPMGRPLAVDVLGLWKADKSDTCSLQLNNCKVTREDEKERQRVLYLNGINITEAQGAARVLWELGLQGRARVGGTNRSRKRGFGWSAVSRGLGAGAGFHEGLGSSWLGRRVEHKAENTG